MSASLILGIGVMATVKVYSSGAQGRLQNRRRDVAVRLVERRIESLDARGAERLPLCPGPSGCLDASRELRPPKPAAGRFPCTQVLSRDSLNERWTEQQDGILRIDTTVWAHPDPEQRSESRMVTVAACWRDARGRPKEFRMKKLVLDGGDDL